MENEGQKRQLDEQQGIVEKGPTERLRESEEQTLGAQVPGAQNPASTEIKEEVNPNTE